MAHDPDAQPTPDQALPGDTPTGYVEDPTTRQATGASRAGAGAGRSAYRLAYAVGAIVLVALVIYAFFHK